MLGHVHSGVLLAMGSLTLMLMELSSTSSITFPTRLSSFDADGSTEGSLWRSIAESGSGVFAMEAFMKLVGVMTEFGVRASSLRGRSKYELPSIVNGMGPRE
jgi:hypothetical protein